MADTALSPNSRKRRQDFDEIKKDDNNIDSAPIQFGNVLLLTIMDPLYPINTKLLEVNP